MRILHLLRRLTDRRPRQPPQRTFSEGARQLIDELDRIETGQAHPPRRTQP